MNLFKSFLLRAALVLAAACAPALALAGPQYHVTIDTRSLAGQAGYLDFLLLGLTNAAPASATLSNFSGDFGADAFTVGDAAGDAGAGVTLGNSSGWNEFGQWAVFGGLVGFDIALEVAADGSAGSALSVALLDRDFGYLAGSGDIVTFTLQPGEVIGVAADPAFATVGEAGAVPEPSSAWLGVAGLLLMGGVLRRRTPR